MEQLNTINREFYDRNAEDFSSTRQSPWQGWRRLVGHIQDRSPCAETLSVLDVGCGNGRFGRFLSEHQSRAFRYLGVDVSARALEFARTSIPGTVSAELVRHDILTATPSLPPEARRRFCLVVAFGLLHHIPGSHRRRALLGELAERMTPQGILAVSIWQFGRFDRFKRKIVPWEEVEARTGIHVDTSQLERGDHILTWGADPPAYRYCHFLDSGEVTALISELPLAVIDSYEADGATGDMNRYLILGALDPSAP